MTLQQQLLKLAHTEPETRTALVPLLRENSKPTREEAEAVADLFLEAVRRSSHVNIKTASQTVDVRKELLRHPTDVRRGVVQLIQKNPSLWGTAKKLLKGKALSNEEKQSLKSKLKVFVSIAAVAGLSYAGLYYLIPAAQTFLSNLGSRGPQYLERPSEAEISKEMEKGMVENFPNTKSTIPELDSRQYRPKLDPDLGVPTYKTS